MGTSAPFLGFESALPSCALGNDELMRADRELTTTTDVLVAIDLTVGRDIKAMK